MDNHYLQAFWLVLQLDRRYEAAVAMSEQAKIRYAVVGLGHFAQAAILPAFANATKNATLAALVTGDAEKAAELSQRYQAQALGYDEYDKLLTSGQIEAVKSGKIGEARQTLPRARH